MSENKSIAPFPCTSCGLCCQRVGGAVDAAKRALAMLEGIPADHPLAPPIEQVEELKEMAAFPFATSTEGRCEKLTEDNRCSVYEDRPMICSVEKVRARWYANISIEEHYRQVAATCNEWIEESDLPYEYLVNVN
jgi:Fe-S-cluster containining protein